MGALKREVTVVSLEETPKIALPNGSWSAMVISQERVQGNACALGYSVFTPGTRLPLVRHETEEVAFVLAGRGKLELEHGEIISYSQGDALFIPAGTWHAVVNDGASEVIMVFGFPAPAYPPTEKREAV